MIDPLVLGEIINRLSLKHNLRPDIVAAIVIQESGGDTFAWRWEEDFYNRRLAGKSRSDLSGFIPPPGSLPSLEDEKLQRSCSFGCMQVLGDTARWCAGIKEPFLTALCDPELGIEAGCRVFSFYLNRARGDYYNALIRYNGSEQYAPKILLRIKKGEHLRFFRC